MNAVVMGLAGAVVGLGLLRLRWAWRSAGDPWTRRSRSGGGVRRGGVRLAAGVAVAAAVWAATRWPTLAVTAGMVGWWAPTAWAARGRAQREQAVVEAVATWAEQLRDTLSAASGLEHAVAATASLATGPLAPPLHRLVERLQRQPLSHALRQFAVEVRHPSADFVAAALITAAEHQARDVGALLGHLAASARDEARLRRRVWVGRARTRTASRLTAAVVVVVVVGLEVLNPQYLDAYADATGQVVLAGVIAVFGVAFMTMERLSRLGLPERFTLRVPRGSVAS